MTVSHQKKILYCVLNWGLGHATRSIPVIKALQAKGYVVDLASDGNPLILLQKTFPECRSHTLRSYNVHYPTGSVLLNVLSQSLRILKAVRTEHRQISDIISSQHYDAIISDNRYGCYHPSIPSILITHQLSNLAETSILNFTGERYVEAQLQHFDEIWIPDTPDRILSGRMTKTHRENIRFIGHVSDQERVSMPKEYEVAAILSGPEPQRTKLETEILTQLSSYPAPCALVRGIVRDEPVRYEGNVTIYPYMDRKGINTLLNSSEVVVCRTGYSSLMDLLQVGTKAILIPTPGQPEQIYLGERLSGHPQFVIQKQGQVDIVRGAHCLKNQIFTMNTERHLGLLASAILSMTGRINDCSV